jgi:PAS domain S-box-containing protein
MNGFASLNILATLLQLVVPSYALRLVRRFGAQRVGWFVVTAFVSLAMWHFLQPTQPGLASGRTTNLAFAISSALLLIGMSHLETMLSQRVRLTAEERELQATLETKVAERTAELAETNRELVQELARREQKEKALKESEAQYRFLFADNPLPMWVFDLRTLKFLAVNQAALRHLGLDYQEFMALNAKELLPAGSIAAFLQDVARPCFRPESRGVWQHCRKDLSPVDLELTAADFKFSGCPARLIVAQDVTQRRFHELDRLQEQRTKTIGSLAGGFAHHFNNILTVINGQANLLLRTTQDAKAAEQLGQISAAANRAATLTRQLVAAGGRQVLKPESLDLNAIIQNQGQTLSRLLGKRISLEQSLDSDLPPVLADRRAIEHILVHLVLNARDAIPSHGTVDIQTSSVQLDPAQARRHREAREGEFVRLAVRDNGVGMPPEVQARLFEPFFTTHDVGRGTGLGLPSVYGAVKQLSGWLEFTSEVGSGTEFFVFLPCATTAPATAAATTASLKEPRKPTLTKPGTVLLVEPDDRARAVARHILNRQGYHVIEVDDAPTAELLWESQSSKIDLVLTEMRLPKCTGLDLVKRFRQTRPDLKAVYTLAPTAKETAPTTFAPAPDVAAPASPDLADLEFITKPFTPDNLLQALQTAWPKLTDRKPTAERQPAAEHQPTPSKTV